MQSAFVWPDFPCHNVTLHVSLTSKLVSLQGTPFRKLFCTALCLSPTLISLSHTQTCSHKKQKIYLFQSILTLKDLPYVSQVRASSRRHELWAISVIRSMSCICTNSRRSRTSTHPILSPSPSYSLLSPAPCGVTAHLSSATWHITTSLH